MDNKDYENFNIDDEYDISSGRENIPESEDIFSGVEENIDLSSNDNNIFDLNIFATDDTDENIPANKNNGRKGKGKKKKSKFGKLLSRKNIFRGFITVFLVFLLTGCIVAGTFGVYAFAIIGGDMHNDIIAKQDLGDLALSYTTVIYAQDKDGNWVEHQRLHDGENRIWVDYDKELAMAKDPDYKGIPQNLANAFMAIEDKRFLDHDGVDWKRTIAAMVNMVLPIKGKFGGSTITQQLVKNITKDDDQKASRKIREIMRARYLEGEYTKEVILECYMNTIAMARGMYGVAVPANYYFGKTVSELTLAECASLACITKSPEYYRPDKNPENNLKRRNDVLYEMLDQQLITQEEYDAAVAEELNVVANEEAVKNSEVINSYFVDTLIEEVVTILMDVNGYKREAAIEDFYNGGYKIYSTMDTSIQKHLETVFTDPKYDISGKDGTKLQGAMTILDYNGNVKGIIGGIGEKTENRALNRATMSKRQPGSTIKPLAAYAPAIENDLITYSTMVDDKKTVYHEGKSYEWFPENWYDHYKGMMTVEYALRRSVNTIPVALVDLLTPQKSYDFVKGNLMLDGLNPTADVNYSPLGMGGTNGGITTYQSAAAFAVFGNGGIYNTPTTVVSIYDRFDEMIYENRPKSHVAVSEDTATIMNHLLQQVVRGKDGTGDDLLAIFDDMPVYAKTGTSNSGEYANDVWFSGGTPYYAASCWCGYDSNLAITKTHEKTALKMWGNVMKLVHEGLAEKDFEDSKYTQIRMYCAETGELATTACDIGGYGWYKTSGQKTCSKHDWGEPITLSTIKEIKEYIANPPEKPQKPVEEENASSEEQTSSGEGTDENTPDTDKPAENDAEQNTEPAA